MAGKGCGEENGLVVIGWTLDGHRVQTGFRTRYAEDKQAVLRELRRIAPNAVDAPEVGGRTGSLNPGAISRCNIRRTHTHRFCLRLGEHPPKACIDPPRNLR